MSTNYPWRVLEREHQEDGFEIVDAKGERVADDGSAWGEYSASMTIETARRIVACVNATAGIPTDMLEAMPSGPASLVPIYARLEKQRDELLAALDGLLPIARLACGPAANSSPSLQRAESASARVKGGDA